MFQRYEQRAGSASVTARITAEETGDYETRAGSASVTARITAEETGDYESRAVSGCCSSTSYNTRVLLSRAAQSPTRPSQVLRVIRNHGCYDSEIRIWPNIHLILDASAEEEK